jgi:hypothetical protein
MLNIHDTEPSGTRDARHALYALIVPESGAALITMAGECKTIAKVFLAPGDGLSRSHRSLALAHPQVIFTVRGDYKRAPSPKDFHQVTLRWGIDNADSIGIWSAPYPECSDAFTEWRIAADNAGARFVTIIETTIDRAAEWAALVRRWKRRSASLRFFGPESTGVAI